MYVLPKPEYMIWSTASAGTNDYCTSSKDRGLGGVGWQSYHCDFSMLTVEQLFTH